MSEDSQQPAAEAAPDDVVLQPSVVALLDVLGFKSLELQSQAKAMKSARLTIAELTAWMSTQNFEHTYVLGGPPRVTTSWFSDTICLVAQPPLSYLVPPSKKERELLPALLDSVAMSVGYLLRRAATAEIPLVFRGVITVGRMAVIDDNIYVGAPIAEASTLYEQADGAFVWLSPAAYELPQPLSRMNQRALVPYEVPFKDGRTISTKVVNPFIDMVPRAQPGRDVRNGIVRAMQSNRVDVVIKRQNTINFMDYVAETEPPPIRHGAGTGV